ncbi:MAG: hypothetical protein KAT77_06300 [Nanoarchaeota archaeon]|nr:hypothetical protein [Nanoarchaeota archaeon]
MNKITFNLENCFELVRNTPGLLDILGSEGSRSRQEILNDFFKKQDLGVDWTMVAQTVFYAIGKEFKLYMGFCPHFQTSDPEGKIENILNEKDMFDYDTCSKEDEKRKTTCLGIRDNCYFKDHE